MTPNKTRRLRKRSKQTRAHAQAGEEVAQTIPGPLEHPSTSTTSASVAHPEPQATSQGHLGCPDRIYLLASIIFQNIHPEKPASRRFVNYGNKRRLPLPEMKSEEQRRAYELAFNTLKYQGFLEAIITDSFGVAPPMSNDNMSLFVVMLYDFQKRKFLPRQRREKAESIPTVALVEKVILGFKTKLAASVARHRIKHHLISVDSFLPETVKIKQERSGRLPIYAWVNTLKSSPGEVQQVLTSAGFSQVNSIGQLVDGTFCWDRHCTDTLVFPACCRSQLHSTGLLSDHKLAIQDKSCGLGPNAVFSLLPEDGDVLLAGRFSGLTVSHTAALIARKSNLYSRRPPGVYVCVSDHTDAQRAELQETVTAMGCKNVTLIPEDFQSLAGMDKRLQDLRVILLNPKCSLSAVSDPVEIIVQEHRDPDLLQDLSQGSIGPQKLTALVLEQRKAIDHALMFPKVLAVVYATYSSYAEENEKVVKGALQTFKASFGQAGEPEAASFSLSPSPFSVFKDYKGLQRKDNFFMLEASEESNGCFLAVLKREPEPVVKETPREVILRAYATGLLDGIGPSHLSEQHRVPGAESRPVVPAQSKTPRTKSSWGVTQGLHLMSHTKASQAKAKQQQTAKPSKGTASTAAAPLRRSTHTSGPSSSKLDLGILKKRTSTLLPAASPASDAAPAARPHLEPKQVVLTLPVVHFKPLMFLSRGANPKPNEPPINAKPPKSIIVNLKHPFTAHNE